MTPAIFSLQSYIFDKVSIDLSTLDNNLPFTININPKGQYNQSNGVFILSFTFDASQGKENPNRIISVRCKATYKFNDPIAYESFPSMFFANSIAILFPYVRAFVSTLTLQANLTPPIIIPTLNLTSLEETLKANIEIL